MTRRDRQARARRGAHDVRPHLAGLRRDEPDDDARARPALAARGRRGGRPARRPRARRVLRHRRPRGRGHARRGRPRRPGSTSRARMLERARAKSREIDWVQGDAARAALRRRRVRRGHGRLRRPQPRRPRARAAPSCGACCGPGGRLAILEITQPRGVLAPFYRLWFDRLVAAARAGCCPAARRTRTFPRACAASRPGGARRAACARRASRTFAGDSSRAGSSRCTSGGGRVSLATIRETPGLDAYLDDLEAAADGGGRRRTRVSSPRSAARRWRRAASGCGRCWSSSPRAPGGAAARGGRRRRARAHGDPRPRRSDRPALATGAGRAAAWASSRPRRGAGGRRLPVRAGVRRARRHGRPTRPFGCLAERDARPRARRGAPARARRTIPDTSVEATSSAARSRPGSSSRPPACSAAAATGGLGEFGLALGIAFQIADDILDCSGRDDRDRARSPAPTCARERRRCR